MPQQLWAIYDTANDMWCARYSVNPNFTQWGSSATAQIFSTKQDADNAIAAWPQNYQLNKIGSNPPGHP